MDDTTDLLAAQSPGPDGRGGDPASQAYAVAPPHGAGSVWQRRRAIRPGLVRAVAFNLLARVRRLVRKATSTMTLVHTPEAAPQSQIPATCRHCGLPIIWRHPFWIAQPRPATVILDPECPERPRPGGTISFEFHEPKAGP
ncbi:hypothetical protein [Streptomyces albidoflavus]|uniref:hypothetical protein n=1 Tax=Streptomyces albidoflavus TaxID=1886 RepID=UPI003331E52F